MRPVVLLALLLALLPLPAAVSAAPTAQTPRCRFFPETGGYNVCDDAQAGFLSAFERWGLQHIGYPVSRRYTRDGFTHQAFQKAIMQARPDQGGAIVLVNVFDDLSRDGFDQRLLETRQTPLPLPGDPPGTPFEQVVATRQGYLNARPALRTAYFSVGDPLTFFGLPTSQVQDMGNHFAIRLQRAVLQEWKENVPWARIGEVTIANGGDIAKELGGLPAEATVPEAGTTPLPAQPPAPPPAPQPTTPPPASTGSVVIRSIRFDGAVYRVESDEYAEIANVGAAPVNLRGWRLNAGDGGQDFYFPDFVLNPGAACRVYTNEYHPETCGFSYGRGSAIWNNDGDCGFLYDPSGALVDDYCY